MIFPPRTDPDLRFSVAIVEPEQRACARLLRLLKGALSADGFSTIDEMDQKLDLSSPCIAVFGPSFADETALKEIQILSQEYAHVGSVLVLDQLSTEILQQALRAGVRDVIARPGEASELLDAIDRVAGTLGGKLVAATQGGTDDRGRLITVVSTKGGAGKSVISSNLAVLLAQSAARPVALVDADLQFGDVAIMLKLDPKQTIVDVMSVIRRLEPDLLKERLVTHEASGLLVLPAPLEPAFADQVRAPDLVRIVNMLQSFCAFVVVDTAPQLDDIVLALMEESDDILLVCALEIPSVKNAKLALQTLRLLNIPLSKIRLVLNRSPSQARLDVREVERALQLKVEAEVPSHAAVARSVNQGIPVALGAPRSPPAKSLQKLARLVLSAGAGPRGHR